jgi:hypothetical protein
MWYIFVSHFIIPTQRLSNIEFEIMRKKYYLSSLCFVNTKREPLDIETGPILFLLLCTISPIVVRNEANVENVIHFAHKIQLAGAPIFRCGNRNIHLYISHHRVTFLPSQQSMILK